MGKVFLGKAGRIALLFLAAAMFISLVPFASATICTGRNTWGDAANGLQICEISKTLNLLDNRCQQVPAGGGSWTYTFGIIRSRNIATETKYSR